MNNTNNKKEFFNSFEDKDIFWFGLDKLELQFESLTKNNIIILGLLKKSLWNHWTIKLTIWWVEYEFIYVISKPKGYPFGIFLKYEYKWEIIDVMNLGFNSNEKWSNKITLNGKFFRLTRIQNFLFVESDILDFLANNFNNLKIISFHYYVDILSKEYFLWDLYGFLVKNKIIVWNNEEKKHLNGFDNLDEKETIYIWNKDIKNNKDTFTRIYNKKREIRDNNTIYLYQDYIWNSNEITRFEIEFRPRSVVNISFNELYDRFKIFSLLISKLVQKWVLCFWKMKYDKILIKRKQKEINKLPWSTIYKVKIANQTKQIKGVFTQLDKFKNEWIDILESYEKYKKESDYFDKYEMYVFQYQLMIDTIIEYLINSEIRYKDLKDMIRWHIDHLEKALDIEFSEFKEYIQWPINLKFSKFAKMQNNNFIILIYLYYNNPILYDDKLFSFLDIFNKEDIIDFCEKKIKNSVNLIKNSKSSDFLITQNSNKIISNEKMIEKILNVVMKI